MKIKVRILVIIFTVFIGLSFLVMSTGIGRELLTFFTTWAQITAAFAILAGFGRFIWKEMSSIRFNKNFSQQHFNSIVIVVAALFTFSVGFFDWFQGNYTFDNIIREHSSFLVKTSEIMINEDGYFSKFPAKKKLVLYLARQISPDFTATEEMLAEANLTRAKYAMILKENLISKTPDITFLSDDEKRLLNEIKREVRDTDIDVIAAMLPIANETKKWFDNEIAYTKKMSFAPNMKFDDLFINNRKIEHSGEILAAWFKEMRDKELPPDYSSFITYRKDNSDIAALIATSDIVLAALPDKTGGGHVKKETLSKIAAEFMRIETTANPQMKGILRWIYRYAFDPLFSSFAALLLVSMLSIAFKLFSTRAYSYYVIAFAFCLTLLDFVPGYASFITMILPEGWAGPLSADWMMNVLAVPVFRALSIGVAIGLLYFAVDHLYSNLFSRD